MAMHLNVTFSVALSHEAVHAKGLFGYRTKLIFQQSQGPLFGVGSD